MKNLWIIPIAALLLGGCAGQETFETLSDEYDVPVSAVSYYAHVSLPEEAAQPVMESGSERLYLCEEFSVSVQKLDGGDMERTLREVTGMERDSLTVMETKRDGFSCYECAWTAAGETMEQICRTVILDDGSSHHAVTVMADYSLAGDLTAQWQHILDSVSLISTG